MTRDALERRYDGPVPPADPALAGLPPAGARARLFDRLAGEARAQAARRRSRRDFAGSQRAAAALACYRAHGVAWRYSAERRTTILSSPHTTQTGS